MHTRDLSFDALQKTLVERADSHLPAFDTLVVLPSLSFAASELAKITAIERYEERLLSLLLELEDPAIGVVYITSLPIDPAIIEYYLRFVLDADDARRRLSLMSLGGFSGQGLARDLATDAVALGRVQAALDDRPGRTVILPFNVSDAERQVALELGAPLAAVHPDLVALGSKTGSRQVARAAGVPVLPGVENLWSTDEISAAVDTLHLEHPDIDAVVVKLNNGFSGQGNAMVTWSRADADLADRDTVFCASDETWSSFAAKIAAEGAIVEQLVHARSASPSAQAWISPRGNVTVLSTHDQVLGGPGGQVYLGCRFPADAPHRDQVIAFTRAVGRHLADAGVVGPFGIDYSVVSGPGDELDIRLSEINLRLGGTTHPFAMARIVTRARADAATGLHTDDGDRVYVATDNLKEPSLVGVSPAQIIARVDHAGLAFDPRTRTGVTLHLLGAVERYGKLGAVCIARSHDQADALLANLAALLRR